MKNTLIISGHPNLGQSNANRSILEKLADLPGVVITDVRTCYPHGQIDVQTEQQRLRDASLIILQFPFVWYGMPSHLRSWMEAVFAYGFAYGEGGNALRNKQLLLSITLGGSSEAYSINGQHSHPVENFLLPIEMFAAYCGMNYLPPVYSYAMVAGNQDDRDALSIKVAAHVLRLVQIIQSGNEQSALHSHLLSDKHSINRYAIKH